jgi:hypothetical protein
MTRASLEQHTHARESGSCCSPARGSCAPRSSDRRSRLSGGRRGVLIRHHQLRLSPSSLRALNARLDRLESWVEGLESERGEQHALVIALTPRQRRRRT